MEEQLVVFELAGELYGIDIHQVQTITQMQQIMIVPRAPHFVEGVMNMRGQILPVIDLRKRFGLPHDDTKEGVIVVVELDKEQVGMIVDKVTDVRRISTETVEPPSTLVAGPDAEFLRAIARDEDQMIILLDLRRIFSSEEEAAIAKATAAVA
jgi:purine-binding chemotaxis protein CheW